MMAFTTNAEYPVRPGDTLDRRCGRECAYDSNSDIDFLVNGEESSESAPKRRRADSTVIDDGVKPSRLFDLAVVVVATKIPFKVVQQYHQLTKKVDDTVVLEIAKNAFPTDGELVKHFARLARPLDFGDYCRKLKRSDMVVKDATQIGLSFTGTLIHRNPLPGKRKIRKAVVSVLFDRRCITSTTCSVHRQRVVWCKHVVRLVQHRIRNPDAVAYRLPISFTLERLSLTKMKQFVCSLVSTCSTKLLPSASKAIDDSTAAAAAFNSNSSKKASPLEPDLTARGNKRDLCQWQFDENRIRAILERYCWRDGTFLRGGRWDFFEEGDLIYFDHWYEVLNLNKELLWSEVQKNADHDRDWAIHHEVDSLFVAVDNLLKLGNQTVLRVLEVLTEQWLVMMEKALRLLRRRVPSDVRLRDVAEEHDAAWCKNKELIAASGRAWHFPDQLIACWRLAVLNPVYSHDVIERLRAEHIAWAIRLSKISNEACQLDEIYGDTDADLFDLNSMSDWNGFCHVQALASPMARDLAKSLACQDTVPGNCWEINDDDETGELLRTVSCFIRFLQFYGYGKAAASLSAQVFISGLSLPVRSRSIISSPNFSLSAVKHFHNEMGQQLWGRRGDGNSVEDPIPLTVLLQAVVDDDCSWHVTFPVSVITRTVHSQSQENKQAFGLSESRLPLPLCILVECIESIPESFRNAITPYQIDFVVELNKILLSVDNRLRSLPLGVKTIIPKALSSVVETAVVDRGNMFRLNFLLRVCLHGSGHVGDQLSFKLLLPFLGALALNISDHIKGQGNTSENFFLALTFYSWWILHCFQICRKGGLNTDLVIARAVSCVHSIHPGTTSPDGYASHKLGLFLNKLLEIADLVCPGVFSDVASVTVHSPTESLTESLNMLQLPCCTIDMFDEPGISADAIRNVKRDGMVAAKILTNLLRITRCVKDDRVTKTRFRALRALCGIATIVDGAALVEVIIAEDTADLEMLSSEAASKHLFYDLAFMKSFKSRERRQLCPSVEKVVREVIFSPLPSQYNEKLVEQNSFCLAVKQLDLVPLLVDDILNDSQSYQLSFRVMFRLADVACAIPFESLTIALKAYKTLWTYCSTQDHGILVQESTDSVATILRGAHCLGAAAMQLDMMSTLPGSVTAVFTNTDYVLQMVMLMWVDPIVSLHIVAEMARIHQGGRFPPRELEFDVLQSCEWSIPSSAMAYLCQMNRLVTSVLDRCKDGIIAMLAENEHIRPWPSSIGVLRPQFKPKRRLLYDDFLCLSAVLTALPRPSVDLCALMSHDAPCRPRNVVPLSYNYYQSYYSHLMSNVTWAMCLFSK